MIPEIRKILFATDLSEKARYAFSYAADVAARYSARIVILHVRENLPEKPEAAIREMLGEKQWKALSEQHEKVAMDSLIGKRSENKLIKMALGCLGEKYDEELSPNADQDLEIVVKSGNIVEEIISQAASKNCGMIIMGYSSRNMLAESILGGICRKVLRRSQYPVLLVPTPYEKRLCL